MTQRFRMMYKKFLLLFIIITIVGCAGPSSLGSSEPTDTTIERVQLTQDERAFLDGLGELQVLVDDNFSPITYYDVEGNKFAGIGVDVLQILAESLQFKYHIIRDEKLTWSDRLDKIKNNEIQILVGASRNTDREQYGVFTEHEYFTVNYALIQAIDNYAYIANMDDIKNYKVGLSEGATINDFILTYLPDPAKITYYPSKELAFEALKRHEIDLYPFNEAVFKEEFFGGELFDFEVAYSIKEQTKQYAFFFPKNDTGIRLAELFDKGMEHIEIGKIIAQRYNNKSNFALYKDYLENLRRTSNTQTTVMSLLIMIVVLSLAVIANITLWNRRLKDEILKRVQVEKQLEQMAMTDVLTSLLNRRAFLNRAKEEIQQSIRYHHPLSLMMIDLDHFKNINDTYGHSTGDQLLCFAAETLKNNIRNVDILARLGGEEFGIMMPDTKLMSAVELAERLRSVVESTPYAVEGHETGLTVSIGVASTNEAQQEIDALLKDADIALYNAKNQGRNRVEYLKSDGNSS